MKTPAPPRRNDQSPSAFGRPRQLLARLRATVTRWRNPALLVRAVNPPTAAEMHEHAQRQCCIEHARQGARWMV